MTRDEEIKLVEETLAHKPDAEKKFIEVVKKIIGQVMSIQSIYHMVMLPGLAWWNWEDASQDAWVRVWKKLPTWKDSGIELHFWLWNVVNNAIRCRRRSVRATQKRYPKDGKLSSYGISRYGIRTSCDNVEDKSVQNLDTKLQAEDVLKAVTPTVEKSLRKQYYEGESDKRIGAVLKSARRMVNEGRRVFHSYEFPLGRKFSKWTITGKLFRKDGCWYVLARCACGLEKTLAAKSLLYGRSHSCHSCAGTGRRFSWGPHTKARRKRMADATRESWKDPVLRRKRILAMRKPHAKKNTKA